MRKKNKMKKIESIINNHNKLFIVLFFVILFAIGLLFVSRVNGNFDENTEQSILLSNIKDYSELLHIDPVTNYIHKRQILAISVDPNRDHGIASYYLFTPILLLKTNHSHFVSLSWHVYTFCIAFIGVIFFYKLINYLFKNQRLSVLMTTVYYFTPRLFIDSLHNNKDIVMMSLLIPMIYFGTRMIKEKKIRWALLFAVFGAFVSNVKVIGLFFVGVFGLGYIVYLTIKKEWSKKNFAVGLIAALSVFAFYIMLTPAIWGDGFKLIEYIQYCLGNAVDFSAPTAVRFEGEIHLHTTNPLPWYYIPKLVLITMPIILTGLFLLSILLIVFDFIKSIIKKSFDEINYYYLIVLVLLLVPLIIALTSNPNLYNGWRHFYFLYSLMLIISTYIVSKLFNSKISMKIIVCILSLLVIFNLSCIFKYGPANTAYYNILAGKGDLSGTYELDYYNVTSQDAFKKFMKTDKYETNDDGMIYLYSGGFGETILRDMKSYIDSDISQKIVIVNKETYPEKLKEGKIVYNLINPVYRFNDSKDYELVYTYKIFDNNVIYIFKMN